MNNEEINQTLEDAAIQVSDSNIEFFKTDPAFRTFCWLRSNGFNQTDYITPEGEKIRFENYVN